MPPGPPLLGDNRFALLADRSPQSKRKKRNRGDSQIDFPPLPTHKPVNPKYIVVAADNAEKPLSHYSCFAIHRALNLISKEIISISQLRDGNLLLLVNNDSTAKKFLNSKELFGICKITCKLHEHLNFVKGTVFAPCLINISEKEIVDELNSQGVVDVYKYVKTIDGKSLPSGVMLLTFDLYNLPESIDVSWYKVKVREYIPNPMRCKKCQLLGHTKKRCQGAEACVNCNLPPHADSECTRSYCANCTEDHPSSSNKCKKFIEQKEILKIKTKRKCPMREAIKIYREQSNTPPPVTSFSAVTASNQSKNINSSKPTTSSTAIAQSSTKSNIVKTSSIQENPSALISEPKIRSLSNNKKDESPQNHSNTNTEYKTNNNQKQTKIKSLITETENKNKNTTTTSPLTLSVSQSINNIFSESPSYTVILSESSSDVDTNGIEFMATDDEETL